MSAASADCLPAIPAASDPSPIAIRRDAFYLASQGQPLFTWLHSRQDAPASNHGVILCPPIGYEQLHAHRALRHLADALAAHAGGVLRFDWHGTADSAGSDEDPERLATWLANLRDAARWMRIQLGCQRLSVIGLRMGAMLAARA
ncbi:MAG TPA: hypothetical protein VHY20_10570, partial [Pirellulales bacterium]|nr:hypothetical protein [Pirellulales bacterium]